MANAAAKKAAAAKHEAAKIYMPLLVVVNIVYVVLLLGTFESLPYGGTKWGIFGMIVTWMEQVYAYVGILESSAIAAGKANNKDLAGGANLDLLAATILVQFCSVLHSTRWFILTVFGAPIIAAYKLYKTFYGSTGTGGGQSAKPKNDKDNKEDDPLAAKRQRRAEKRRQKWG